MFEFMAFGGVVLLVLIILAAVFFEAGRASFKKEIQASWHASRCRECGAAPEPRIRHVTGCEADWPRSFEAVRRRPVNAWLTWKARMHHWMFPVVACQCHVCAEDRREEIARQVARRLVLVEQMRVNKVESEKCPKI